MGDHLCDVPRHGAAFGAAILGIYVLVVAQFGSFRLPLVILTPIPLTLIGIMLGHWLFGAPFTATSMIGFIALAGIIVRNSILLVDFIRHGAGGGKPLSEILLEAGAVRFKPILLTALAAMIGAATILLDPIFQGLAISLLFGLASSTLLTVLVIPAIYIVLRGEGSPWLLVGRSVSPNFRRSNRERSSSLSSRTPRPSRPGPTCRKDPGPIPPAPGYGCHASRPAARAAMRSARRQARAIVGSRELDRPTAWARPSSCGRRPAEGRPGSRGAFQSMRLAVAPWQSLHLRACAFGTTSWNRPIQRSTSI